MKNVFVKINNFRLVGKGDSFIEIDPITLESCEVNLSKKEVETDKNLIVDFNDYNSIYSLFSDYSINHKVETVKEIIHQLLKDKKYISTESLVDSIKRTLELRNSNYQAAIKRNTLWASFK